MPLLRTMTSKAFVALSILLAASIGLTACGGSSSSTPTPAAANVTSTPTTTSAGPGTAGTTTAPTTGTPTTGTTAPGGASTGTSSTPSTGTAPTGTSSTSTPPAGTATTGTTGTPPSAHIPPVYTTPRAHRAFARFAACMRQNGIPLPEPNTTGKGPLFDTKGIDTTSAKFKAAGKKCRFVLFGTAAPNTKTGAGTGA
jgi:hypothetical protein